MVKKSNILPKNTKISQKLRTFAAGNRLNAILFSLKYDVVKKSSMQNIYFSVTILLLHKSTKISFFERQLAYPNCSD